ncbi:hypothetical protein BACCOP_00151 [Phocaeicola coprocola DSM 17136]|uniref:Uncharacterized protein n=1 Tax=Phocaeicola coprocola DSM 17136 TaxID=470145 RepID=B3JE62_9BACT|nr:hypothetical protein BACCOP_00151 [Phocaeicola coprocola DSM 17136]
MYSIFFHMPVPNLKDLIILSSSHCGNNTIQQIIFYNSPQP